MTNRKKTTMDATETRTEPGSTAGETREHPYSESGTSPPRVEEPSPDAAMAIRTELIEREALLEYHTTHRGIPITARIVGWTGDFEHTNFADVVTECGLYIDGEGECFIHFCEVADNGALGPVRATVHESNTKGCPTLWSAAEKQAAVRDTLDQVSQQVRAARQGQTPAPGPSAPKKMSRRERRALKRKLHKAGYPPEVIRDVTKNLSFELAEAMRCLAEEVNRLGIANRDIAPDDLQHFVERLREGESLSQAVTNTILVHLLVTGNAENVAELMPHEVLTFQWRELVNLLANPPSDVNVPKLTRALGTLQRAIAIQEFESFEFPDGTVAS